MANSERDREEEQLQKAIRDKCHNIRIGSGTFRISFNPVVTFASAFLIWIFVVLCLTETDKVSTEMIKWMKWVTKTWTWLYIGTQDVWAFFIIYLFFSKYSHIKLGKDDDKPEFSDSAYFTMLFAAGIGTGMFFYGVAEPIYHYAPNAEWGNRYQGRYSDNQKAQDAINLTIFHWGVHGWIVYDLIALALGFLTFRKNMPMTMRSCFYPLIGDKIYGLFGDVVDVLTVVCTMFGVCTSLGIGVLLINSGVSRLNSDIAVNKQNQIILIWCITVVATLSVVSGLRIGIRRLSEICFAIGMFLWFYVLFSDDTWYILNVFVQSVGYYLQWLVQLGFHTDAFAQLGDAPDKKQAVDWMNDWTVFYWGWWIAWAPLVGIFIAKISRGRTIRSFITYTLTIPVVYCLMWFSVFGGAGLRMERAAQNNNITCTSALGGKNSTESFNGLYRLSCRPTGGDMWFDVLLQYGGSKVFLSATSLVAMILYFVTSSDSGSLVIDSITSNGHPDPPVLQRIFWALTEGAAATALVAAGGKQALTALQSVSICSGLVYTIVLNFVCVSLWRVIKIEVGDMDPNGPQFRTGLLDYIYSLTSCKKIGRLLLAIFAPWWPAGNAAGKLPGYKRIVAMLFMALPFYAWILLEIFQVLDSTLANIGWAMYLGFVAYATGIRAHIREKYQIDGNLAEDMFAVMLAYPLAVLQMEEHMSQDTYDMTKKDQENGDPNEIVINLYAVPREPVGNGSQPAKRLSSLM